uniref:F-box only protein n=1 Tax=Paramormyrops kingsleyae TaxID=1676925 RepID=A0A3B3SWG2_9TELE
MALLNGRWERELQEQISLLSAGSAESSEQPEHLGTGLTRIGLLHLSDEVLILILRQLDPVSLLRVGSTCRTMFRICSCSSLWTPHFQASFGVPFAAATCSVSAKDGFRLIFMWRTLYKSLHFNRSLQEKLFAEIPFPPDKYWIQWLVLEETVPLPPVRLAFGEIETLWGIQTDLLERKEQETADEGTLTLEWSELHRRALQQHGSLAVVFQHVLNQHEPSDHRELEDLFYQYRRHRFHWFFSYWLFRQPAPLDRQLRTIYLQWRPHSRRKVSSWGSALCDVRYLASLHQVTADYWRGRLACGDEAAGIQTVENYFSMCKSLVAWILGRGWGGLKRKKVYEDTLRGVYRLLRREMLDSLVERDRFWQVAKMQMCRVCTLAETAINYVNWKMIETLPYYKRPARGLCERPADPGTLALPALWAAAVHGGSEGHGPAVCPRQSGLLRCPGGWRAASPPWLVNLGAGVRQAHGIPRRQLEVTFIQLFDLIFYIVSFTMLGFF